MSNMNLSNITDEQLMWEAKKRFAIPIYFNKKQADKQLAEMDDNWKTMSNDEWDNFKDDFNNKDEETTEQDFDRIEFACVAYFRFWDGTREPDSEEETHDCNQCSYSLTSKEFYEGKGRIMFSEGDGIKEGEYKCDDCHKKKKKKKKHKRLVIVPNKLCKSTECKLIKDEEWNMKCAVCDGYYKDDGLHDILDVNDDENRSCKLCENSDNVVIMKGTGSCVCAQGCDVDSCKVCGEEFDENNCDDDGRACSHLCVDCDQEENCDTLFAQSNPLYLLRCKNCKKNDNLFAMDDPELCVPCVDLLHYSNK